jgi:uncharacterized protein DUF899/TrkA family protein
VAGDVTLLGFSRAPIERLAAYKRRMGWQFRYVSTCNTGFAFDFGLALTEEQAQQIPELQQLTGNPPGWLQEWPGQIGAQLKDGLRENPGWIALRARERHRLPHLHGHGTRPVRRALLQLPARTNAESTTRRTPQLAQGQIPGLTPRPKRSEHDSRLHGVEIAELRLPRQANVALIVRDGHGFVPDPAATLQAGDRLLIVAAARAREQAER